jgi:hypothetical protein
MPPRIKPCLESSRLQSQCTKRVRSTFQRSLHSNFWISACPNALPWWWDALAVPFANSLPTTHSRRGRRQPKHDNILDFLYPPGALALYKSFSRDQWLHLAWTSKSVGKRSFSSTTPSDKELSLMTELEQDLVDSQKQLSDLESIEGLDLNHALHSKGALNAKESGVDPTEPLLEFRTLDWTRILDFRTVGKDLPLLKLCQNIAALPPFGAEHQYDAVWDLYQELLNPCPLEHRLDLVTYLSFSSREKDRERLLELMTKLDISESGTFWKAVLLSVYTNDFEKAFAFYESAIQHGWQQESGANIILAHALRKRKWAEAVQIFTTAINSAPPNLDAQAKAQFFADLWKTSSKLPDLADIAIESHIAGAVRQLPFAFLHQLSSLATTFANNPQNLTRLLDSMQEYGLSNASLYESAIQRVTSTLGRHPDLINIDHFEILATIWSRYRERHIPGRLASPLISNLFLALTNHKQSNLLWETATRKTLLQIIQDCSQDNLPLSYSTRIHLMNFYSKRGHFNSVKILEGTLSPKLPHLTDNDFIQPKAAYLHTLRLKSLLRVHAVKGDATAILREHSNLLQICPSAAKLLPLWNIVVNTIIMSGDISKAFKVITEDLPAAGVSPNAETIQSLLKWCSFHGDIAKVSYVLELAQRFNIGITPQMEIVTLLTHLKYYPGPLAEEALEIISSGKFNTSKWLSDDFSRFFTSVLRQIANRHDLRSANRVFRYMVENKVPITQGTYEAMLVLLARHGLSIEALHFFTDIMIPAKITPAPNHFVALMKGFLIDNSWRYILYLRQEMLKRGLVMTPAIKQYYLKAVAMRVRMEPRYDQPLLEMLHRFLYDDSSPAPWVRDSSPFWYDHRTDAYFTVLIDAYCDIGVNDMAQAVKKMFEDYRAKMGLSTDPPVGILRAFMKAALSSEQHEVVETYWHRILQKLESINRSISGAFKDVESSLSSATPKLTSSSLGNFGSNVLEQSKEISNGSYSVSYSIGHLIDQPLTIYINSLGDQQKFDTVLETVENLRTRGFTISSKIWSLCAVTLLQSNDLDHLQDAFKIAEKFLMPHYPHHINFTESRPTEILDGSQRTKLQQLKLRQQSANYANFGHEFTLPHLQRLRDVYIRCNEVTVEVITDDVKENVRFSQVLDKVAPKLTASLNVWPFDRPITYDFGVWRSARFDVERREARSHRLLEGTAKPILPQFRPKHSRQQKSKQDRRLDPLPDDSKEIEKVLGELAVHRRSTVPVGTSPDEPISAKAQRMIEIAYKKFAKTADTFHSWKRRADNSDEDWRKANLLSERVVEHDRKLDRKKLEKFVADTIPLNFDKLYVFPDRPAGFDMITKKLPQNRKSESIEWTGLDLRIGMEKDKEDATTKEVLGKS